MRIKSLFVLIFALLTASCVERESAELYKAQVETIGGIKYYSFEFPYVWKSLVEAKVDKALLRLTALKGGDLLDHFDVKLEPLNKKKMKISIMMKEGESIPDGSYVFQMVHKDKVTPESFIVEFRGELLHSVQPTFDYSEYLDGKGTSDDPYLVYQSNFLNFLYCLSQDSEANGAGLYFKQTEDIDLAKDVSSGKGYTRGQVFAGHYDGGGFNISNLVYKGVNDSEKDVNIGLFSVLTNGATISNLSINSYSLYKIRYGGGGVAGCAKGNVTLTNIFVHGSISNTTDYGDGMGGLIGVAEGANLTVKKCSLMVNITDINRTVGGVVGYLHNSKAVIDGVTANAGMYLLSGYNYVGGVIGISSHSEFSITNVTLNHQEDEQNKDVDVITGSEGYVGGIVGSVHTSTGNISITNSRVKCPVKTNSGSCVGGLVGSASSNKKITLSDNVVSGYIYGKENVGGIVGSISSSDTLIFQSSNKVATSSNSYTSVEGSKNVGGIIGRISKSPVNFKSTVTVHTNVIGAGSSLSNIGGVIGYIGDSSISLINLDLLSTSKVTGGNNTGGLIGCAERSSIYGGNKFDFLKSSEDNFSTVIPKFDQGVVYKIGNISGNSAVGGAIGYCGDCQVEGIFLQASVDGKGEVGGLFGTVNFYGEGNGKHFLDCKFSGDVKCSNSNNVGGIVGLTSGNGRFQDCINYGEITGHDNTGGVVGKLYAGDKGYSPYIYYCVNTGPVTANGDLGGVIGYMYGDEKHNTVVRSCANTGKVSSPSPFGKGVGGIVGNSPRAHSEMYSCANHGKIEVSGSVNGVGGIAGSFGRDAPGGEVCMRDNSNLQYCANFGEIKASGSSHVGGILGNQEEGWLSSKDSYTANCYNYGNIPSKCNSDLGGIVGIGSSYAMVEKCINFGTVSHGNASIGTRVAAYQIQIYHIVALKESGKDWHVSSYFSSEQASDQSYFEKNSFDFTNTWIMRDRPYLRSCPFQSIVFEK